MKTNLPEHYHFCTYFDCNYLTRALVLYESLVHYSDKSFTLWVLCFDDESYHILNQLQLPGIQLITEHEFEADDEPLLQAKANRSRVEYYWTCTPSLPLYLLKHHPEISLITYLDADQCFYNSPRPVYEEMANRSILIIEHRYAPEHAHQAAQSGIFNVGILAFRRDPDGLACLHWWRERCIEWCYAQYEDGKFGDQKYLDDWPTRFSNVAVLQHKGTGVAPWNLAQYRISSNHDSVTIDDEPLIFFHFHSLKQLNAYTVVPAPHLYQITMEGITLIYLPYIQALEKTGQTLGYSAMNHSLSQKPAHIGEILYGILTQRFLLTKPLFLTKLLWQLGNHHRLSKLQIDAGMQAWQAGDIVSSRQHILTGIRLNPLLLRYNVVVYTLLRALLGLKAPYSSTENF